MTETTTISSARARLWRTVVVAAIGLSAAVLSPMSAANPPDTQVIAAPPSFDLTDPARIAAGKKRFNKTCAGYCHGAEGVGGRAPDFKGRTDLPDEEAYKTIFYGRRTSDIMPPWGEAFSSDQIWELVAYLKFLGTQ